MIVTSEECPLIKSRKKNNKEYAEESNNRVLWWILPAVGRGRLVAVPR
jgi:hypothetical protein